MNILLGKLKLKPKETQFSPDMEIRRSGMTSIETRIFKSNPHKQQNISAWPSATNN